MACKTMVPNDHVVLIRSRDPMIIATRYYLYQQVTELDFKQQFLVALHGARSHAPCCVSSCNVTYTLYLART